MCYIKKWCLSLKHFPGISKVTIVCHADAEGTTRVETRGKQRAAHTRGAQDWQRNAQPTTLISFPYVATAEMICTITMSEYCGKRGYTEDVCRTPQAEDRSHLVCDYCIRSVHITKQCPIRGAEARKERLFRALQSEANQQPPHYT